MSVYFDTSVAVSLFIQDAHTPRVSAWLAARRPAAYVSSWTATEFSSALALRQRLGGSTLTERRRAEQGFDEWITAGAVWIEPSGADFGQARRLIRHDQAALRAPDALHLAIASRRDLELASLDVRLADAGRRLGLTVSAL